MKDKIVGTLVKRIEIVESELHDTAIKNTELNKDLNECKVVNNELKPQLKEEKECRTKELNELEQYGRRNNIRISGLPHDDPNEHAHESTEGVLKLLNNRLGLSLGYNDIDIASFLVL